MTQMQPFDLARKCMKCGSSGARAHYTRRRPHEYVSDYETCSACRENVPEHIHRCCAICGFAWAEEIIKEPMVNVEIRLDTSALSSPEAVREFMALAKRYIRTEVHGANPSKIRE